MSKRPKKNKWKRNRKDDERSKRIEAIKSHIKVIENGPRAPMTRPGAMEGLKGFQSPRIVFDEVCSTCRGKGEIRAIAGGFVDCPRCRE